MEKITFYGTRGSSTLTSSKYAEFGGATTCILFNFGKTHIMVDCGSGISNAIDDLENIDELHLLISHTHLDHINGIPALLAAFKDKRLHIYGKSFGDTSFKESIYKVMNEDLWPVRPETYKNIDFIELNDDFCINDVKIYAMDSNHPGGCSLFRFEYQKDFIVTAFDFCHLDGYEQKLIDFAYGCTTLIYDGTLNEDEFEEKKTWGHSTPEEGARIGQRLGCKNVLITHFGLYDDIELSKWEKKVQNIYPFVSFARSGKSKNELKKMVEIGALLSTEKNNDKLLTKIVETTMEITSADGGTLYLLDSNKLEFKVLINKSKKTRLVKKDSPLDIPPVDLNGKNVCSASAREKKLINIPDCYKNDKYDFSGTKKYDELNDYLTKSVLVIPMIDEYNDVVGVLQLINAKNNSGETIAFDKADEEVLMAITNQASMAYVNSTYSQKINDLLYGFVKVMSVEIDERTPYNANHTRNMVKFADKFFEYEELTNSKYAVDDKKKREILMSIWLHDIGKILTPIDIMNKDSRLGEGIKEVLNRFERRELLLKLFEARRDITKAEYDALEKERNEQLDLINSINRVGFLDDGFKAKIDELALKTYKELDGSIHPILTQHEIYQLSIVKGTLNKEERSVMEGHVSMTQKFLSQLSFPKYYDNIPMYAGNHHEFLDGSGYPNHLKGDDLPWPGRLITICDIFEALTAKDRPYKKAMSVDKSLEILFEMAEQGKLDKELVEEFKYSHAWED